LVIVCSPFYYCRISFPHFSGSSHFFLLSAGLLGRFIEVFCAWRIWRSDSYVFKASPSSPTVLPPLNFPLDAHSPQLLLKLLTAVPGIFKTLSLFGLRRPHPPQIREVKMKVCWVGVFFSPCFEAFGLDHRDDDLFFLLTCPFFFSLSFPKFISPLT